MLAHDVKWPKLVFSHLPHSTLKFERNATGFLGLYHSAFMRMQRNATIRSQMNCDVWHSMLRCPRNAVPFSKWQRNATDSANVLKPVAFRLQTYCVCGMPQSALHIWAWNVALDWNLAPAIFWIFLRTIASSQYASRSEIFSRIYLSYSRIFPYSITCFLHQLLPAFFCRLHIILFVCMYCILIPARLHFWQRVLAIEIH
jgi:hypothetical protein